MIPSADLRADILHAMRRLASLGEVDVSPMRIADLISPRPYLAEMETALDDLLDEKAIDWGRVGKQRYRLAQEAYVPDPEALRLDVGT